MYLQCIDYSEVVLTLFLVLWSFLGIEVPREVGETSVAMPVPNVYLEGNVTRVWVKHNVPLFFSLYPLSTNPSFLAYLHMQPSFATERF